MVCRQGGEDILSVQKKVAAIKVKDGIVNGSNTGVNTAGAQSSGRFNGSTSTSQSLADHLPTKTVLKANSLAQQLEGMKTAGTEHFIKNVVIEPPTGSRPSRQSSRQAGSGNGGNPAGLEPSRPNQARRSSEYLISISRHAWLV